MLCSSGVLYENCLLTKLQNQLNVPTGSKTSSSCSVFLRQTVLTFLVLDWSLFLEKAVKQGWDGTGLARDARRASLRKPGSIHFPSNRTVVGFLTWPEFWVLNQEKLRA